MIYNFERIDNKLSNSIYTSGQIITELNDQSEKINDINNKLYDIKKCVNLSKCMYKMITSWFYRLDYFDIYNRYINYSLSQSELIEMNKLPEEEFINTIEIEDNVVNKLKILKERSIYINEQLDKQNENLQNISNDIHTITIPNINI